MAVEAASAVRCGVTCWAALYNSCALFSTNKSWLQNNLFSSLWLFTRCRVNSAVQFANNEHLSYRKSVYNIMCLWRSVDARSAANIDTIGCHLIKMRWTQSLKQFKNKELLIIFNATSFNFKKCIDCSHIYTIWFISQTKYLVSHKHTGTHLCDTTIMQCAYSMQLWSW